MKTNQLADKRVIERKQKSALRSAGAEMLLKNGPPMEAPNVVVYHAETNENIYSYKPAEVKEPF